MTLWNDDEEARFGQPSGDVELVATTDEYDDEYCDNDDGVGFDMNLRGGKTSRGRSGSKCGKLYWCTSLVILGVMAVVAMKYGGDLLTTSTTNTNNNSERTQVSPDSIVQHKNYDILLKLPVSTVEADLVLYQHAKTKTPVMTILPYDQNQDSVFGISFRTKPNNSHGAPHVLEHSVLAGSKKYPLKDPFTQVLKGSLNTFVNAMTFDDLTAYICASRNTVDFTNLMNVYMDAVFAPLVVDPTHKWIFRQEGWRVEMNDTGEPEFNGVVLSEMKGATSNFEERLAEFSKALIFPNTTYRFNSGGEPSVIPQLTHEELTNFYKTYYHPSNAQVVLYGNPTAAQNGLQMLDEYLQQYEHQPEIRAQSMMDLQPLLPLKRAKHERIPYASDSQDDDHHVMQSWLISKEGTMGDAYQRQNRLAYTVLDELLMNSQTGVLYQALLKSGLGGSIEGGIEQSLKQWTFDLKVTNVNATQVKTVINLIQSTLQQIVQNGGFDKDDMESALNTVEFMYRDISSSTSPRGILIWWNIMDTWKYDLDPLTGFLSFERDMNELRDRIAAYPTLFVDIIQHNLLNNSHAVTIDMYPDPQLSQRQVQDEQTRLKKLRQSPQFPALLDEASELAEIQVTEDPPDEVAKIPSVTVEDLDRKGYEAPIVIEEDFEKSGVTMLLHEVDSSFGLVYIDFGVDISMLDLEDVVLVSLLAQLMKDAGTEQYSDVQISREVGKHTGGISEYLAMIPILPHNTTTHFTVPDGEHFHSKLFLRGSAAVEKSDKLLELISQMMFHATLDAPERAKGILREHIAGLEKGLTGGGTRFASSRLRARYSALKFVEETYKGTSALPKLRDVLKTAESDWESVLKRLQGMMAAILKGNRNGMVLNLTGEKAVLKQVAPHAKQFVAKQLPNTEKELPLPKFATEPHPWVPKAQDLMATESPVRNEGVVTTTTVNFVGYGAPFFAPYEKVPGSVAVVTQYIEFNNFMLQIRERRGAYGAFAIANEWTGQLEFMTYRDPNLLETLEVYRNVPKYLQEQVDSPETSDALIQSAIIGSIGTLDGAAPQPNTAGWTSLFQWLGGSTPTIRQAWRDEILATTSKDFLEYAKRMKKWEPTLAVAGPKTALEKEKDLNMTLIDLL